MNKFCINNGLHTYPFQALCDQCICACYEKVHVQKECVVQIQLKTFELIPDTIPVLRLFQRQIFLCKALYCKLIAKSHKFLAYPSPS